MWHIFRRRMASLQCYRRSSNDHLYSSPGPRGRPSKRARMGVGLAASALFMCRSVWRGAMNAVAIFRGRRKIALYCFSEAQEFGVSLANRVWPLAVIRPSSTRKDDRYSPAADVRKCGYGEGMGCAKPGRRFVFICCIKVVVVDAASWETADPQLHSRGSGMFRTTAG